MTRGAEMTESRPSRGRLKAEPIESSRPEGTWGSQQTESRDFQRYLQP